MGKFEKYEVVVGPVDDETLDEIDRFIQVRTSVGASTWPS